MEEKITALIQNEFDRIKNVIAEIETIKKGSTNRCYLNAIIFSAEEEILKAVSGEAK